MRLGDREQKEKSTTGKKCLISANVYLITAYIKRTRAPFIVYTVHSGDRIATEKKVIIIYKSTLTTNIF